MGKQSTSPSEHTSTAPSVRQGKISNIGVLDRATSATHHVPRNTTAPGSRKEKQSNDKRTKRLQVISNAFAHHVSVTSGKPEVHPIISKC